MHDEGSSDSYGRSQADDPWNDDKRKAYVKRMTKESHELPEFLRRPDYASKSGQAKDDRTLPAPEEPRSEQAPPKPSEKKKEEYEL